MTTHIQAHDLNRLVLRNRFNTDLTSWHREPAVRELIHRTRTELEERPEHAVWSPLLEGDQRTHPTEYSSAVHYQVAICLLSHPFERD
ncbi:hypothetical protein ACFWGG_32455, partial [Streptomyces roseolus]